MCSQDGPFLSLVYTLACLDGCLSPSDRRSRVGGIVSETSQKFFVLFVFWGAVYCVFSLILMAKFVAERAVSRYLSSQSDSVARRCLEHTVYP